MRHVSVRKFRVTPARGSRQCHSIRSSFDFFFFCLAQLQRARTRKQVNRPKKFGSTRLGGLLYLCVVGAGGRFKHSITARMEGTRIEDDDGDYQTEVSVQYIRSKLDRPERSSSVARARRSVESFAKTGRGRIPHRAALGACCGCCPCVFTVSAVHTVRQYCILIRGILILTTLDSEVLARSARQLSPQHLALCGCIAYPFVSFRGRLRLVLGSGRALK